MCSLGILEWLDTDDLTESLLLAASKDYEQTHAPEARAQPDSPTHSPTATHEPASPHSPSTSEPAPPPHSPSWSCPSSPLPSCSSSQAAFFLQFYKHAAPKTNKEIEEARRQGIPRRTQQDTQYCVRLWEEWRQHRNTVSEETVAPLSELSVSQLNHSLSCFVLEI